MPFYEYVSVDTSGCATCRERFTRLEKISDPPLSTCPDCGQAVKRVISPPHVVSGKSHMLKESSIEKAGFTQYKKIGKGVYEKTAGKGPDMIKGD
ncbi:MAG: zinc ribbon domain-containing protein [Wenzhouxiangellaceae bacterium]|nr:zinc ribbon domain-containing protein [Wenzhouxiangellaceae bacterium]